MNGQTANLIRGVRVEGGQVIVVTKDNATARFLCDALLDELHAPPPQPTAKPARACPQGAENPCLPCLLDHGDCTAPVLDMAMFPPFDGVEEAQMADRRAGLHGAAGFDPYLQTR